jgi:YD repeat-containing protein
VSTVAVTRTINPDGTVATETSTGTATTTYAYDAAGRVTSVSSNTPGRVPVTSTYTLVNQQWVSSTTTRGAVSVTTDFPGR